MTHLIEKHLGELAALCRKYGMERLGVFGSAVRADFDEGRSDLDFLVEFRDLTVADGADR